MTIKHFSKCETLEDLKQLYKKLMLKFHPDINPNGTATAQEINAEYDFLFERLKNTHRNSRQETYTTSTENTETVNEFKEIINIIIHFANVKIELIGNWIWISGDTKPYKDNLKQLKFRWSAKKTAWYFHNESYRKKSKNNYTMDQIRNLYGSEEIKNKSNPLLQF